ncbi:MAG: hypothetical protein RIT27_522 [Pseudomonadota bacterium]
MAILTKQDPTNLEEYLGLIEQALFEVSDLRAAVEFDMEGMESSLEIVGELERDLQTLKTHLTNGSHIYANGDLPYMSKIKKLNYKTLPFKSLLEDINRVHRNGMRINDD